MTHSTPKIAFVQSLLQDARHNITTLFAPEKNGSDDENYIPDKLTKSEKQMKDTSKNEVLFSVFDIQGPITEPPKTHQTEEERGLKEVQLLDVDSSEKKVPKKKSFI